jgi:hypothetical protein
MTEEEFRDAHIRKMVLAIFSYSKHFAENSITIIGDIDDGYYFNQWLQLIHNFFIRWEIKHAYQEIDIQRLKIELNATI